MEIAAAIIAILAAVLPVIMAAIARNVKEHNALRDRSLRELHLGTERVRGETSVPPQ